ncbi:hypothetical protein ACFFX0_11755 [Citricoccus parietis]|uniref:Uncharacterized protein n=1 Tax=Citricoccus parietis TaxID=592307 RepID=A0ABV5FZK7_9MICC
MWHREGHHDGTRRRPSRATTGPFYRDHRNTHDHRDAMHVGSSSRYGRCRRCQRNTSRLTPRDRSPWTGPARAACGGKAVTWPRRGDCDAVLWSAPVRGRADGGTGGLGGVRGGDVVHLHQSAGVLDEQLDLLAGVQPLLLHHLVVLGVGTGLEVLVHVGLLRLAVTDDALDAVGDLAHLVFVGCGFAGVVLDNHGLFLSGSGSPGEVRSVSVGTATMTLRRHQDSSAPCSLARASSSSVCSWTL